MTLFKIVLLLMALNTMAGTRCPPRPEAVETQILAPIRAQKEAHNVPPLALLYVLVLVTYFVEKRTRRRYRPLFHLLMCGHSFFFGFTIIYDFLSSPHHYVSFAEDMSVELCQVNKFLLMFQAFILESSKEVDCFATVVVAFVFCILHVMNLFSNEPLISLEVTRSLGILALIFVCLRTLDLFYCY